jgi:hybrid polyketide synthase/nonribosomal peptide synthetase ACE1
MKRKLNYGSAYATVPHQEAVNAVMVHPAYLDVGFQSIFLAYWWPNDGSLDQLHVPRSISNIRINVPLCQRDLVPGTQLQLDSHLTENPLTAGTIRGDVDFFGADGQSTIIQVQGVQVVSFSEASPESDRQLYSEHIWGLAFPAAESAADNGATLEDYKLAWDLERVSIFYMKKLQADIKPAERMNLEWHHEALFDFVSHILSRTEKGEQRFAKREWLYDTWEQTLDIMNRQVNRSIFGLMNI